MLSPDAQNALIDLTTAIAGYENAWRAALVQRSASGTEMPAHFRAAEDAHARLGSLIGVDTAAAIRAALVGTACTVHGERPEDFRDPSSVARIIRRPHDYF